MKRTLVIGVIFGLLVGSTAVAQSITVTKPAVNETWYKGGSNPYTIVWTKQGQLPPTVIVSLRNSADTAEILTIANGVLNSGSCPWTPPASVASGSYRIRVWTPSATGTSAIFSIASVPSGPLKVTAPNGGESWPLNSSRQITWTPGAATGNVKIELYRNGTAAINKIGVIAPSVAATAGTYGWTVGAYQGGNVPVGAGYRIMVTATTPALQDASDNPFTIAQESPGGTLTTLAGRATAALAPLHLTQPTHTSQWMIGTPATISWNITGDVQFPLWLFLVSSDHKVPIVDMGKYGSAAIHPSQVQWTPTDNLYDGEYCVRATSADNKVQVHSSPFHISASRIVKFDVAPPAVDNRSRRHEEYVQGTAFGGEFIAAHMPDIPNPGGATIKYGYQRWYEDSDNHGYRLHHSYVKFDLAGVISQLKHKATVKSTFIDWVKAPNSPQACAPLMFILDAPVTNPHDQLFFDGLTAFPKHQITGDQSTLVQMGQRWLDDPAKNYGIVVLAKNEGQEAENGQCVQFATNVVLKLEIVEKLNK